jgi:hypothetical protein
MASGGEVWVSVGGAAPRPTELERLEALELRPLAEAIGDHLPVELAERVERLRAERRAIAGGPPLPGW